MNIITSHSARWGRRCLAQGLLFLTVLLLITDARALTPSITLGWNPSTDPTVVGYVVYYGTNSTNFTYRDDVGTNTQVTITNLIPGLTYDFAITDYNSAGVESAPSGVITYLVPGVLQMSASPAPQGVPQSLSFPVEPSHWYEVQGSADFQTWTTLWQTPVETDNIWVQFTDTQSAS